MANKTQPHGPPPSLPTQDLGEQSLEAALTAALSEGNASAAASASRRHGEAGSPTTLTASSAPPQTGRPAETRREPDDLDADAMAPTSTEESFFASELSDERRQPGQRRIRLAVVLLLVSILSIVLGMVVGSASGP